MLNLEKMVKEKKLTKTPEMFYLEKIRAYLVLDCQRGEGIWAQKRGILKVNLN